MQRELFLLLNLSVFGALALGYCGPHTVSTPCGDPCQRTCGQLTPKYCSETYCEVNGCVCVDGYVRRDENGPCIPILWCRIAAEEWNWVEEVPAKTLKLPLRPKWTH